MPHRVREEERESFLSLYQGIPNLEGVLTVVFCLLGAGWLRDNVWWLKAEQPFLAGCIVLPLAAASGIGAGKALRQIARWFNNLP